MTNQSGGSIQNESIFNVTVVQLTDTTFTVNLAYVGDGGYAPITSVEDARFAFLGPGPASTGNKVAGGTGGTNGTLGPPFTSGTNWSATVKNLPFGPSGDILFTGGPSLNATTEFYGTVTLSQPLPPAPPGSATGDTYVDVTLSGAGSGEATLMFPPGQNNNNLTPDGASLSLMVPGLLSLGVALRLRRRSTKRT